MNTALIDEAIALAGALAEAGVQTIEFRAAGASWQSHAARVTDLPGLLAQAGDGTELRWCGGSARIEQGTLKWYGGEVGKSGGVPPRREAPPAPPSTPPA